MSSAKAVIRGLLDAPDIISNFAVLTCPTKTKNIISATIKIHLERQKYLRGRFG